jgi:hypothetical protein
MGSGIYRYYDHDLLFLSAAYDYDTAERLYSGFGASTGDTVSGYRAFADIRCLSGIKYHTLAQGESFGYVHQRGV